MLTSRLSQRKILAQCHSHSLIRSAIRSKHTATGNMKNALILGAGYVSAPVVEYLNRDPNVKVTVASRTKLPDPRPRLESVQLDVVNASTEALASLISKADVVVSLLPYSLHPQVAQVCINQRVNMVTASYCSPAMGDLDKPAKEAGITVVNECGLDPGIDHFLAVECFDKIRAAGGKIESFISFCGGLAAPEYSNNPLRYRFSWSPRGVLLNALSSAKYLLNNQVVEVPAGGHLLDSTEPKSFLPEFNLEGFANRDSTVYTNLYEIPEAHTILRGTLRFKGFSNSMKAILKLKLIDPNPNPIVAADSKGPELTWRQLIAHNVGAPADTSLDKLRSLLLSTFEGDQTKVDAIEQLGLLGETPVVKKDTPLDTLSFFLAQKLALKKGERDLIILRHEIIAKLADGRREMREINMIAYGEPNGYSAMAKMTGYPAAIAAKMVLDGEIQSKGMVLPFEKDIYQPMLDRLKAEGVTAEEKSHFL